MADARDAAGVKSAVRIGEYLERQAANQSNHIAMWVEEHQPLDAWGLLTLERMIQEALETITYECLDGDTGYIAGRV